MMCITFMQFQDRVTPERTLEGTYFRSDEHMTHYTVSNSKGSFVRSDMESEPAAPADTAKGGDTAVAAPPVRPAAVPRAATSKPR